MLSFLPVHELYQNSLNYASTLEVIILYNPDEKSFENVEPRKKA